MTSFTKDATGSRCNHCSLTEPFAAENNASCSGRHSDRIAAEGVRK
jgi:hypothetical protein